MKKYIIDEENLISLLKDSWELTRLINNGVDNWAGYGLEDDEDDDITPEDYIKQHYKEINPKANYVDLGVHENAPIDFKFDTSINKPVLCRRCDNYYYAYPTKTGWVYYRSRYLGERDKEIKDIPFEDWAYAVLESLYEK